MSRCSSLLRSARRGRAQYLHTFTNLILYFKYKTSICIDFVKLMKWMWIASHGTQTIKIASAWFCSVHSMIMMMVWSYHILGVRCVPHRHGAALGTARLHTATPSPSASHPKITTHPSVVSRETDPRWQGENCLILSILCQDCGLPTAQPNWFYWIHV